MIFIDSNVIIGAFNPRDKYHKEAAKIIRRYDEGVFEGVITDYIMDEILTFIRRRSSPETSIDVLNYILSSDLIIMKTDRKTIDASYHIFRTYKNLSFTDSTVVVFMKNNGIKKIISFDERFDSVDGIERISEI
ncbi:MAG: type II toxin-antitoxin system VapC family toxin [Candidatus Hydrothermarchaeota archaeon]